MSYRDLTPRKLIRYIGERTTLFAPGAVLRVHAFERLPDSDEGDGYVNHIYRVSDEFGSSVIVKQAKPYLRAFGEGVYPLPVGRNASEAKILEIRRLIVPQYIARLLHVDFENNLYICEDWGELGIMRFELAKGRRFPEFPERIAEFMARCHFYTSELYLDTPVYKELGQAFVNAEMLGIMETVLFLREPLSGESPETEPDPVHAAASDAFWRRREVRVELLKLRDVFMKKRECLIHGDLHTSNILIGAHDMKVFDMEYTAMGPYSADPGYLLGNVLYAYITWFYRDEETDSVRAAYRAEVLSYVGRTLDAYIRVFTECWMRDGRTMFAAYPEYVEDLFATFLQEVCGFMGAQIASRVGSYVDTPDFEAVRDPEKRNRARALAMTMALNLIVQRNNVRNSQNILSIAKNTADSWFDLL